MAERQLISIVCAVYNEEACIPIFYDRVRASIEPFRERYDFELLFTNNCSTDGSLDTILRLRRSDPRVQVITYTRNYGYEASIATGLRHARGDAIVVIDVDCQDPPEMIAQFLAEWERGYDVVYGKRDQRLESAGMQLLRKAFYRLHRLIADSEIVLDMGEFYLVAAPVRDAMLLNRSTKPFLRSELAYVGFRRTGISYTRQHRAAGITHHKLLRATEFAVAGILTSSTFALRLPAYAFPVLAVVNLLLLYHDHFQGLVVMDLLYLAFFVAMACLYLARTYKDVVQRPITVIDWKQSAVNAPAAHGMLRVPA
jgi:glycosyltransferase involved in cell wall biosynthesis